MNEANAKIGRASAAFALAAAIAAVFNTLLAWAKDAYRPLNSFLASLTGNGWIAHGLADAVLFAGLGLIFSRSRSVGRIAPNSLILLLVAAVAAGIGLFAWYALY